MNRVFLDTRGQLRRRATCSRPLKAGHGFVSNGPLLGLLVDGRKPGEIARRRRHAPYRVALRSPVPVDHLELVSQRQSRQALRPDRRPHAVRCRRYSSTCRRAAGCCCAPGTTTPNPLLLDLYPYATTNPVWLEGPAPDAHADAAYFIAWLDRVIEGRRRTRRLQRRVREGRHARLPARSAIPDPQARGRPTDACPLVARIAHRVRACADADAVHRRRSRETGRSHRAGVLARRPHDRLHRVGREPHRRREPIRPVAWSITRPPSARASPNTPKKDESRPQWSPDGKSIAFLSDRGGEEAKTQVWSMPARGGEAKRLTKFGDDISDFVLSPDGKRIAVHRARSRTPVRREGTQEPAADRHRALSTHARTASVISPRAARISTSLDIATGKTELLTPGAHDEQLPAWSPDGKLLAYVTKRGVDPDRHLNFDIYVVEPKAGAQERQLTTFTGSDLDPYWETRPTWSPDSTRIAYLRSGEDKWIYYTPWQLAIVDVATGTESIPAPIDRCFTKPRWSRGRKERLRARSNNRWSRTCRASISPDGKVTPLTTGPRFDYDLDVSRDGRIVVLGGGDLHPYDIAAVEPAGLRTLADHNEFLEQTPTRARRRTSTSATATVELEGLLRQADRLRPRQALSDHRAPARRPGVSVQPRVHGRLAGVCGAGVRGRRAESARRFRARLRFREGDLRRLGQRRLRATCWRASTTSSPWASPIRDRLGIGGWSYGAILTNAVIARDTRFKAAISGAGASNMYGMFGHDQYIREYELELGTPWDNREVSTTAPAFPSCTATASRPRPCSSAREADAQRALPRRRADVPGPALAQRAHAAGGVSGRKPRAHCSQLPP